MYDGILIDVAFAGFFLAKVMFDDTNSVQRMTHDVLLYSGLENRVS